MMARVRRHRLRSRLDATPAAAAACNYTGPAGGSWTTAANWSCAAVPGAADDVTIDTGDDVALGDAGDGGSR